MENNNNDESEIAIMSMRKLVIKDIKECNDIELLDFIDRLLKLNAEGRAD